VQEHHFQVTSMSSLSLNSSLSAILLNVNPLVRCSISLSLLRGRMHVSEDGINNGSGFKEMVNLSHWSISPAAFPPHTIIEYTVSVVIQWQTVSEGEMSWKPFKAGAKAMDSEYLTLLRLPSTHPFLLRRDLCCPSSPSDDSSPSGWSAKIRLWIEIK